jgi:hypothetical protein
MKPSFTAIATAVSIGVHTCLAPQASAIPTAYHNPATGNLRIRNDSSALAALWVQSASTRMVVTQNSYAAIPGAIFDFNDTPIGITYLDFPPGEYDIGNVVESGTPCADLSLGFYYYGLTAPPGVGVIICVPEPSTVAMTAIVVGVAYVKRRRRSRRDL